MRKVIIENEFVLNCLNKKDKLTEEINKIVELNAQMEKDFNDIKSKLVREDEKVRPELVREGEQIEKDEYEVVSRVYLGKEGDDKGKVIIEIADRLEEFKTFFKQEKDAQNNSSNTPQVAGDDNANSTEPAPFVDESGDLRQE